MGKKKKNPEGDGAASTSEKNGGGRIDIFYWDLFSLWVCPLRDRKGKKKKKL